MKMITKLSIAGISSVLVGATIVTSLAMSNLPQKKENINVPKTQNGEILISNETLEKPIQSNFEVKKLIQPTTEQTTANSQVFCNGNENCVNHDADGDGICDITGQPVGSGQGQGNGQHHNFANQDADGDGICDITGQPVGSGQGQGNGQHHNFANQDADGDGICDITGQPVGSGQGQGNGSGQGQGNGQGNKGQHNGGRHGKR